MSLLTICAGAAASLSIPVPTVIAAGTDDSAILFFQLAKQEGRQLMRRHDWQGLVGASIFTSTATEFQSGSIPSDYDRIAAYTKLWNVTAGKPYIGPIDVNTFMRLKLGSGVTAGSPGYWLIALNAINIYPAPSAGDTLRFNYISKNYCQSSGGATQSDWAADADTAMIPEHLMELGIVWRWLRAKGMDYAEEMAAYEREVEKAASRDRGPVNAVVVDGQPRDFPVPYWPGTITV